MFLLLQYVTYLRKNVVVITSILYTNFLSLTKLQVNTMAFFQLLLFVLFALNMSTMFSGFMLARRMGMYLMMQVMMLMLGMFVGLGALAIGFIFPTMTDILYWIILVDLVLVLLAFLMEFGQVLPILMKTMQGGPIHSSHITNLIVTLFYLIGLFVVWGDIILI